MISYFHEIDLNLFSYQLSCSSNKLHPRWPSVVPKQLTFDCCGTGKQITVQSSRNYKACPKTKPLCLHQADLIKHTMKLIISQLAYGYALIAIVN